MAGIACIRMDREAASLREGRVSRAATLILVSRADYERAMQVLAAENQVPGRVTPPEPG